MQRRTLVTFLAVAALCSPALAADVINEEVRIVRYRVTRVRKPSRDVSEVEVSVRLRNTRNAKFTAVGGFFTPTTALPVTPVTELVHFPDVNPRATVTSTDRVVVQVPKSRLRRFKRMLTKGTAFTADLGATEVPIPKGVVRVIDDATCAAFVSFDPVTPVVPAGARTYVYGDTPFLRALHRGNIVITTSCTPCAPDLPIRVESISFQGQTATLIATPITSIVDIWENATFTTAPRGFRQSAGPNITGAVTSVAADGCDIDPADHGEGSFSVDTPSGLFFPVNDIQLAPGVTLSGNLALGAAEFTFEMRIRDGVLERAGLAAEISQHLTLEARAETDAQIVRIEVPLVSSLPLPGFHVNVGGVPVEVQPFLSLYVGAEGSVTAGAVVGGVQSTTAHFAAGVLNGQPDAEATFDVLPLEMTPPQLTSDTGMSARLFGGAEIAVQIEYIGGPTVKVEASIDVDVDPTRDPWWDLTVGARSTAGMQLAPLGIDIAEADFPITSTRHGGLEAPTAPKRPGGSARAAPGGRRSGQAQRWAKSIALSPNSDEHAGQVLVLAEGTIVTVGHDGYDGFVLRHDTAGSVLSTTRFGFLNSVFPQAVAEVPGIGFLVAGEVGAVAFAAMLDESGSMLWKNHYDFGGAVFDDLDLDRIVDPVSGSVTGFVLTGSLLLDADYKAVVARLDAAGAAVWARTYTLPGGSEQFFDVKSLAGDGFVACGYLTTPVPDVDDAGGQTGWVARLAGNGDLIWSNGVGSAAPGEYLRAIVPHGDGFVAVGNTGTSIFSPHKALFVASLDSTGAKNSLMSYAGPPEFGEPGAPAVLGDTGFDTAYDVIRSRHGFLIAGKTDLSNASSAWLLRLDDSLDPIWWLTADGAGVDEFTSVADAGDGFVALGHSTSFNGQPARDFLLARVPYDGQFHFAPSVSAFTNYSDPAAIPLGGDLLIFGLEIKEGSAPVSTVVADVPTVVTPAGWSVFDVTVDSTEIVQR